MQKIPEFKPKFIERYSALTDFEKFKEYSFKYLRRAIRVNTLKISVDDLRERLDSEWLLTPVPWCKEGFWIDHKGEGEEKRRDVGNLIEHALGYIYIQEPASMIPPIVLNPKPGDIVLDMCSSPGSKASQIAMLMKNKGFLVCNDYKGQRMAPLGLNMQRVGATNFLLTLMEGRFFKDIEFDRILVDAPCSGTGTIRKSLKTIQMWNPNMVCRLAGTQRQLLSTAYNCLKKGGTIVYSTCSNEPDEDEGVVSWFIENYPDMKIQEIKININRSKPVTQFNSKKYHPDVDKCLRIWPQDNDTEGFFVAKFRKE